ncbi:MAG: Na(+)-translocating NADH-quinone reductase subunit A [Parachlamydiaceae bacterium]
MVHIKISKGLDIPIAGKPTGAPQLFVPAGEISPSPVPHHIGLDLSPFDDMKFKVLVRIGDKVKLGQPLLEDKDSLGRYFVSPAGGVVREIRRGLKRRLLNIIIDLDKEEEIEQHPSLNPKQISKEELIERLKLGGLFTHIRQRPFNSLANPNKMPRTIFVKGLESAPFTPDPELQVQGYEKEFQVGLDALSRLTDGSVHLVYRQGSTCKAFLNAQGVQKHTAEGPHPIANPSLHISKIDPIDSPDDVIWTVSSHDVVAIGYFLLHGQYFVSRIISIAGNGIIEGQRGYFKVREGYPIALLVSGRIEKGAVRLISGNPLTGHEVQGDDYLGFEDTVFCAIPENHDREFLHFFRLGANKYTFSGAYLSGHLDNRHRDYPFTTHQHGEHRAFIDSSMSDDVMPFNISTMHLVKAVLAEDYDLAAELGLLEIDSEDFALPSFVNPSKIEMIDIIKKGLRRYAADVLK